jgi:hypothetical protein
MVFWEPVVPSQTYTSCSKKASALKYTIKQKCYVLKYKRSLSWEGVSLAEAKGIAAFLLGTLLAGNLAQELVTVKVTDVPLACEWHIYMCI